MRGSGSSGKRKKRDLSPRRSPTSEFKATLEEKPESVQKMNDKLEIPREFVSVIQDVQRAFRIKDKDEIMRKLKGMKATMSFFCDEMQIYLEKVWDEEHDLVEELQETQEKLEAKTKAYMEDILDSY
ncbi:hypothetical protein M5689_016583 [Euphorbia peplus]|nr:hypothetical protein M5689_016583 [Euphorbia peplus]